MPNYINEFGSDYCVPTEILNDPDIIDQSWHNDLAPAFTLKTDTQKACCLWVEHPDPEQRELGGQRYCVADIYNELWNGEDVTEAIAALKRLAPEIIKKAQEESDSFTRLHNVKQLLKARGLDASTEHPGYISVPISGVYYGNFGTANGPWGGDLWNSNSDCTEHTIENMAERDAKPEEVANVVATQVCAWLNELLK